MDDDERMYISQRSRENYADRDGEQASFTLDSSINSRFKKMRNSRISLQDDTKWYYISAWQFFALLIYIMVFIIGPDEIVPSVRNDANRIVELSYSSDGFGSTGYDFVIRIYALVPEFIIRLLTFLLGSFYTILMFDMVKSFRQFISMSFIYIAPLLTSLCLFQKDTFAVLSVAAVYVILNRRNTSRFRGGLYFLLIYSLYAYVVRAYWMIIALTSIFVKILRRIDAPSRILLIILVMFIASLSPVEVFETLQGSRDQFNAIMLSGDATKGNTAFFNPYAPDSFEHFLANYAYAFARLNVPIFFSFRIQEIYLQAASVFWYSAILINFFLRMKVSEHKLLDIFSAHLMVLPLFEPDLGSYLRHAGTAFLFISPTVARLSSVKKY